MQNLSFHERRVSAVTVVLENLSDLLNRTKQIKLVLQGYKSTLCPKVIETTIISQQDLDEIKNYTMFIFKLPQTPYMLLTKSGEMLSIFDGRFYIIDEEQQVLPKFGDIVKVLMGKDDSQTILNVVKPLELVQWKCSPSWQKGILIVLSICLKYNLSLEDVARFLMEVRRDQETSSLIGQAIEKIGYSMSNSIVQPVGRPVTMMKIETNEPITSEKNMLLRIAQTLGINKDQFVDPNVHTTLGELPSREIQRILFQGIQPLRRTGKSTILIRQHVGTKQQNVPSSLFTVDRDAYSKPGDMMSVSSIKTLYQQLLDKYGTQMQQLMGTEDDFIARLLL